VPPPPRRGGSERNARHIPASFMQAAVGRGQPRRGPSCRCSSASRPLAEAASPASAWATAAKRGLVAKSSGDLASSERRAFMRATDGRSSCCCCTPRLGFRVRAAAGRSCGGEGGSGGGGDVGEGGGVGAGRGRGVGAAGRTAPPLIHRCVTSRAAASAAAHLYTCWGCFVREDQSVRIVPWLPFRQVPAQRANLQISRGAERVSRGSAAGKAAGLQGWLVSVERFGLSLSTVRNLG
jgi:hypothetical protein